MTDFTMAAGDTKRLEFTVRDEACAIVALGVPQKIRWQLADGPDKPAILSKDLSNGISIINEAQGRFDVDLVSADTESRSGRYYHETEIIFADGTVATVDSGFIKIKPTLIKPAA